MVYDWSRKRDECYQMYVEDGKSLDEVMAYMKDAYNFSPSTRAFQAQFKRWNFPPKHSLALAGPGLPDRVRQLWEANVSQDEMLHTLHGEGYKINKRSLARLRSRNKLYLRMPNGVRIANESGAGQRQYDEFSENEMEDSPNGANADSDPSDPQLQALRNALQTGDNDAPMDESQTAIEGGIRRAISPETQLRRQQRLEKLQRESQELLAAKKRRRRTRGWSGMPADEPQPPRFPSETTIDEAKAYLRLDNELYRKTRDVFTRICEENNIERKTTAGPEKWQTAKNQLVEAIPHLHKQFHGPLDGIPRESKQLALDVLCTDNTKRMRTLAARMTISEAKNILQVNPKESREIRQSFYEILRADHFHSKMESGEEHWNELKNRWIQENSILQPMLTPTELPDPHQHARRVKAAETICRDVMKRLRDEQTKQDPHRVKQSLHGPGPGPLRPPNARPITQFDKIKSPSRRSNEPTSSADAQRSNPSIDPSLASPVTAIDQLRQYAASASDPFLPAPAPHPSPYRPSAGFQAASAYQQPATTFNSHVPGPSTDQPSPSRPRFNKAGVFRLRATGSTVSPEPKSWIAPLGDASLADIRRAAASKHPGSHVARLLGLLPNTGAAGGEAEISLASDEECDLYLDGCMAEGRNPIFAVVLWQGA